MHLLHQILLILYSPAPTKYVFAPKFWYIDNSKNRWDYTAGAAATVFITVPVSFPVTLSPSLSHSLYLSRLIWAKTWDHLAVRHEGSSSTIALS